MLSALVIIVTFQHSLGIHHNPWTGKFPLKNNNNYRINSIDLCDCSTFYSVNQLNKYQNYLFANYSMNEDSVHQKLTKVSPCVGAFYEAGLRGEMTNSAGFKKMQKLSLPCLLFRCTIKLSLILNIIKIISYQVKPKHSSGTFKVLND